MTSNPLLLMALSPFRAFLIGSKLSQRVAASQTRNNIQKTCPKMTSCRELEVSFGGVGPLNHGF